MSDYKQVASEILRHLGGRRFQVMTGARQFTCMSDQRGSIQFRLPRAKDGINHVKVMLNASDTYTVTFSKLRGSEFKQIAHLPGVYCDRLQSVFRSVTGLETSLGTARPR